jgi:hypothetical protein
MTPEKADDFYRPKAARQDATYSTEELATRRALSASIRENLQSVAIDTACLVELEHRVVNFATSLKLAREELNDLERRLDKVVAALQAIKDDTKEVA